MSYSVFMRVKKVVAATAVVALTVFGATASVAHQTTGDQFGHVHTGETTTVKGQIMIPTIWVDPDGCEHWMMAEKAT